jgi:hypothetical protein
MTTQYERNWNHALQRLLLAVAISKSQTHPELNGNLSLLKTFGCLNAEHNYHSKQYLEVTHIHECVHCVCVCIHSAVCLTTGP